MCSAVSFDSLPDASTDGTVFRALAGLTESKISIIVLPCYSNAFILIVLIRCIKGNHIDVNA